jgi:hypothetical protein
MFFIVNGNDEEIRRGEAKSSLRRVIRKSEDKANLRIIEGASLAKALKKDTKVTVTKENVTKVVKKIKKALKETAPVTRKEKRAKRTK